MSRDRKMEQVYTPFAENARKAFPYRSMYDITKQLNKLLEEVMFGTRINEKKKTKKRKHN